MATKDSSYIRVKGSKDLTFGRTDFSLTHEMKLKRLNKNRDDEKANSLNANEPSSNNKFSHKEEKTI